MVGNSLLENNGLIQSQGNLYSSNIFQQRGNGTMRLENNLVNTTETQFIQGSYAVRGGQSQIGVNDGSFFTLELANSQGIVWLNGSGLVADVRNRVNFQAGAVLNRIITANPLALPANGSAYPAVFGVMNPAATSASFTNNTADLNGNMSPVDAGYVQGKLRRAISPAGGTYGYYLGLEPAGPNAQRGFQYIHLDFSANNYDVVQGYFQTGSDNTVSGSLTECSGYRMDYFGGADHGEWVFDDLTGSGSGLYNVRVWPQDHNFPAKSIWLVSKDNSFQGTPDDCDATTVGLERTGFNGFSEFGVVGSDIFLSIKLLQLQARPINNQHIRLHWLIGQEQQMRHYELERSADGLQFDHIHTQAALANNGSDAGYEYPDYQVLPNIAYYYRLRMVQLDGTFEYSPVVTARLVQQREGQNAVSVFPNPSKGQSTLLVQSIAEQTLEVRVYDALGRLLHQEQIQAQIGSNYLPLPTQNWATGVYSVQVQGQDWQTVKQWVRE
jgi:hypothetical protein